MTLDPKHAPKVSDYYGQSLAQFRQDLCDPSIVGKEAIIIAGALLCSISVCISCCSFQFPCAHPQQMNAALPFTIHVDGLAALLERQGAFVDPGEDTKDLISLVGIFDLQSHILGRQTPAHHIWCNHCRGQSGVEEISGLPCSLLDLLSSIAESDIEQRLIAWTEEPGYPVQTKLWTATCYAGVISAREFRRNHYGEERPHHDIVLGDWTNMAPLPGALLVHEIISAMRAFQQELRTEAVPFKAAALYPLVAAGSLNCDLTPFDREFIRANILHLAGGKPVHHTYYQAIVTVLEEFWVKSYGRSLGQVALDMNLELGLW